MRHPRFKSFDFSRMDDAAWDAVWAQFQRRREEDASEQARRNLGATDERPLPFDKMSDYAPVESEDVR
jgi:hypothetical protein